MKTEFEKMRNEELLFMHKKFVHDCNCYASPI